VGKKKLARFAELGTFRNVIQPEIGQSGKDHPIKGNWRADIFKNENPVVLELGCGKGEYTIALSERFPDRNYVGVDIKGARLWRGARTAHEDQRPNVAFLRTRIEFINSFFDKDEVDEIWITFPDPHPGKNNSNKRLTCPWFLNSYRRILKPEGLIHLKTDNKELFDYTRKIVLRNELGLVAATDDLYSDAILNDTLSIKTHYENMFLSEGLRITYLSFHIGKEKEITNGFRE
jgi:tRNA (guanine-N7-)-methyltransferase